MSDAPFPPATGDESDDPPKRTGLLRLSDAGIIATSRLDGFGEDPLNEAPATASSATQNDQRPQDAPSAQDASPSDDAAGPVPLANEAADDDLQPMLDLRFPDDTPVPWPSPLPDPPQLAEAVVGPSAVVEQPPHPYENTGLNALDAREVGPPPPPFLSGPPLREASGADEAAFPTELPGAVSPILGALDAAERQAEQTGSITEAGYPFGSRMFMPHPPIPNFGLRAPPTDEGEEGGQSAAAWPAPDVPPPATSDAEPPPPFLSGPPLRGASEADEAAFPTELSGAVSPILSGLDAAERQAERTGPGNEAGYPFRSSMLMPHPPIPNFGLREPPAGAGDEGGQSAAAWPAPDVLPPAISDAEPPPPDAAAAGPEESWSPQDAVPPPAEPFLKAAAKIAAEASATAEALENLKRLLQHKLPILDNLPPPAPTVRAPERVVPPPRVFAHPVQATAGLPPVITRAVTMPPLPMPLPDEPGGTGLYMRGFLAGLGLSLVAGMMLYLFMAIG